MPSTLAETYLRSRAITVRLDWPSLRFHQACYYRAERQASFESWPALLGIVTDLAGNLTGLQRTWLARDGSGKAPLCDPRRAMGRLLGNAVRFGTPDDILAAGEGIETMLLLASLFPAALPVAAGLSAAHLSAILFPPGLRRLYILRDNDAAGDFAAERLRQRCFAGIEALILTPLAKDLNVDLCREPVETVRARMLAQLAPEDRSRFGGGR